MVDPETHAPMEAEPDDYNDADSAIASDIASSTTSIGSSILNYRKENGRTYHAYKDGKYVLPNDEEENERLDLQHHLFYLLLQNKLYLAPIPKEQALHRVLDLGTGTGIWAIDFADEHPASEVMGVDLSPIQPSFIPPNCTFEVDDVEESWTYKNKFDFIHSRMLTWAIADWQKVINSAFENLTPGGYLEIVDMLTDLRSDDGSLKENSASNKWAKLCLEACKKMGRPGDSALRYKQQMIEAGFEDVEEVVMKCPLNKWPKDKRLKEVGVWQHENMMNGVNSGSVALFTRVLGWSVEEFEEYAKEVSQEISDTKIHSYFPIYIVYGRKPQNKV